MEIEVNVIAKTEELTGKSSDEHLFLLGGKMAGVCYMPEDYFDGKIQNERAAINRANMTCESGHHSVFDHGSVSLQISGLPKIMAMLLNSTEQYTTSEKSARYTVMKPETELENEVYNKWRGKFAARIEGVYPDIDEKTRTKLAQENARYLISVFTPTHMVWTTTYRQLAYVLGWISDLEKKCRKLEGDFNRRLADACIDLVNAIKDTTTCFEHIHDNKGRFAEFFTLQSTGKRINNTEHIGDTYQFVYLASFAQLAQLQRHRTIHYEMEFSGTNALEFGMYIPPIIANTELEVEWRADFESVAYCYPQGTLVKVLEQGRAVKFFEKCKERLCGRAQLEIMQNCSYFMQQFINADRINFSDATYEALKAVTNDSKVITKCCMDNIKCKEICMWGASKGLSRQI